MTKSTETFYAARVSNSGNKLICDDDVVSIFTEQPHIENGQVECSVRPFASFGYAFFSYDFPGAKTPMSGKVVKITVTTETI